MRGVLGECKNCDRPVVSYEVGEEQWNHYHTKGSRQSCSDSWTKWAEPKEHPGGKGS